MMTRFSLFALTAAALLAACGTDKPAVSDSAKGDSASVPPPAAESLAVSAAVPATVPHTPAASPGVADRGSAAASTSAKPASAAASAPKPAAASPAQSAAANPVAQPAVQPAVPPAPAPVAKPAAAPAAVDAAASASGDPFAGKPLYEQNCKKCHGATGAPSNPMKAKFTKLLAFNADFFSKRSDDSIVTILVKGKGGDMKSFKGTLSPDEMTAVAAYIRTFVKQ